MNTPPLILEVELTAFPRPAPGEERRLHARFPCRLPTTSRLYLPITGDGLTVWVSDLSRGGAGLSGAQPVEAGTEVIVNLRVQGQRVLHRIPGRVVHVTQEPDRSWRIGCAFDKPISAAAMQSLL